MGIHSDISRLHQKIRECEEGIAELEEAREYIDNKYRIIQEDAYEPAKNFDITCGEQFRGKLEENVEDARYDITVRTEICQNDTREFISQIDATIERLREMICEYEREIERLEDELREREREASRG
ncbi:YwqH-like family protein [Butyrivibrio sp. AE2005]|uniref:YwqH-like family protein n=1 Tax=Butyrivibrio sp. AE2005 TaxID=1496722 RepID=UPI00047D1B95|nr:DUF5082 family protein [Butyrivibrio sp. AE2005]